MDILSIKALCVKTTIGVHNWEQQILQNIFIDIDLFLPLHNCQEDLKQTIDYDRLCQQINDFVTSKPFKLIETLANEVADFIKREYQVDSVQLTVSKPHAIKQAKGVQVRIQR